MFDHEEILSRVVRIVGDEMFTAGVELGIGVEHMEAALAEYKHLVAENIKNASEGDLLEAEIWLNNTEGNREAIRKQLIKTFSIAILVRHLTPANNN